MLSFYFENTSTVTSQKAKPNSSHWKLFFSKLEVLKREQELKQILTLQELNIVDLVFLIMFFMLPAKLWLQTVMIGSSATLLHLLLMTF